MKSKAQYIIFVVLTLLPFFVKGQDVTFSQFYSNPLYLNPAFSGSIEVPRVGVHYRNQWPTFNNAYNTYSVSLDLPVEKLKGGVGVLIMNDAQSSDLINMFQADFMYSSFTRINEDFRFYGGLQLGFHHNSIKWGELVFSDNLDANFGEHGPTAETPIDNPTYSFLDASTGILVFSEKFFFGMAAHHLNEPKLSYYSSQVETGVLYRKYTMHFGAKIPMFLHGHLRKKFDLSPQVILQQQGDFKQFNYGLFVNRKGLSAGVWLRQNFTFNYDALIFLVGFINKKWQFTYSYDWTISGLGGATGGSSEISLSFLLKDPGKVSNLPFFKLPADY